MCLFMWVLGNQTQVLVLAQTALLTEPSPQLNIWLILNVVYIISLFMGRQDKVRLEHRKLSMLAVMLV